MEEGSLAKGLEEVKRIIDCIQARLGAATAQLDTSDVHFDTLANNGNMIAETTKTVADKTQDPKKRMITGITPATTRLTTARRTTTWSSAASRSCNSGSFTLGQVLVSTFAPSARLGVSVFDDRISCSALYHDFLRRFFLAGTRNATPEETRSSLAPIIIADTTAQTHSDRSIEQ